MSGGNPELEALFAAGYAARTAERYQDPDAPKSAEGQVLHEFADEALTRMWVGLPPRTPDERDAFLEWGKSMRLDAVDPLPRPDPHTYGAQYRSARAEREALFQAQVAAHPPPPAELVLYPQDPAAQARSGEAVARLQMSLPPRDPYECETYLRWSQADPAARRSQELAPEGRKQQWLPWFAGADALEELAYTRGRELGIDISRELGTDMDGYPTPDPTIAGPDRVAGDADFYIPPPAAETERRQREREQARAAREREAKAEWDIDPDHDRGPDADDPAPTADFDAELERLGLDPDAFRAANPGWRFLAPQMKTVVIEGLESELAQAREQGQEPSTDLRADHDQSAKAPLTADAEERVHAIDPDCGLNWEGPARAWDDYLGDRHALAHQKGTGGLSASAPRFTVERRAANEAIVETGAGQREADALTRIAQAREQDQEADRDPGPPF